MQQDSEINVQRMFHMVGRAHKVIFMNPGNSKSLKKKGDRDDSEKPKRKFVKWQKGQKAAAGEGAISRHADVGVQCTQRHSGRSRTRGPLCKWIFCVRDDLDEIEAIQG